MTTSTIAGTPSTHASKYLPMSSSLGRDSDVSAPEAIGPRLNSSTPVPSDLSEQNGKRRRKPLYWIGVVGEQGRFISTRIDAIYPPESLRNGSSKRRRNRLCPTNSGGNHVRGVFRFAGRRNRL